MFLLGNCWCCWTLAPRIPFWVQGVLRCRRVLGNWGAESVVSTWLPAILVLGGVSLRLRHHMARTMMASQTVHELMSFVMFFVALAPCCWLFKGACVILWLCRAALSTSLMPWAQAYALLPPPWNTGCHVGILVTCFAFLHEVCGERVGSQVHG